VLTGQVGQAAHPPAVGQDKTRSVETLRIYLLSSLQVENIFTKHSIIERRMISTMNYVSSKKRRLIIIGIIIMSISVLLCISSRVVKAFSERSDYLEIIYRTETDLLQRTEVSRYYHDMSLRHNSELIDMLHNMTPSEIAEAVYIIDLWMPNMRSLLNGEGDTAIITEEQVDRMTNYLLFIASRGSPSLRNDITMEMERLQLQDFIGMTMTQAWVRLHAIWGYAIEYRQ
jgi:hypothetical protein